MRLTGVEVVDERPLAGRLVGWMFVMGSIVTTLLPLLPGVQGAVITPTLPVGIAAGLWGVACLRRVNWTTAPGRLAHLGPAAGALCVAVATHDSGGAGSPARFLLMLVVVYTGYFFPAREAWPYLGLALVLHALPLAYDPRALGEGLLGELLITGKRGMVSLRAHADDLARRDPLTGLASLRRAVRAGDLPARLGGDEFAVLVAGATAAGMQALAERVMGAVRADGPARVSAGWAVGEGDAGALLLAADRALADAERAGKDRVLAAV